MINQASINVVGGSGDSQATFGIYIKKDAALSEAGNILILHPDMEGTSVASFQAGSRHIYVEGMKAVTIVNGAINVELITSMEQVEVNGTTFLFAREALEPDWKRTTMNWNNPSYLTQLTQMTGNF